jgi:hypothetical protein
MTAMRDRTSAVYYIAFALLVASLAVGAVLFVLLTGRPAAEPVRFLVGSPTADDCPVGGRAPACFRVDVTNVGSQDGGAACTAVGQEGSVALFANDASTTDVFLLAGEAQGVFVKVTPGDSDVVAAPIVTCTVR